MDSTASAMVPRLLLARAPLVGMLRRLFEPQGVGNAGTKKAPILAGDEIGNLSTRLLPDDPAEASCYHSRRMTQRQGLSNRRTE
jgi:hypothetical protein